jgi:hypothetical protein
MIELFVDGGCIGRNPSPHGGTWAWAYIVDGKLEKKKSGIVTPLQIGLPVVTNNFTELYAALQALDQYPNFDGTLHTDSQVTLFRLLDGESFKGIPQHLRLRCLRLRRGRKWHARLVAGHPTKKELLDGIRQRNGLPASQWNALCDRMCTKRAEEFKRKL